MSHDNEKNKIEIIISNLIHGNDKYIDIHDKDYFNGFRDSQNPDITLVSCADSRVQSDIFSGDATNRIFTVRNIGNQILPVFGSVDYGVMHLHTPLLLILGHVHCGALKAVLGDYDEESSEIIRELDHLSIPVRHLKQNIKDIESVWIEAVENNVNYQVKLAVRKYRHIIEEGKLTVTGAVEDFINVYGQGYGRVIFTNLNGETDPLSIKGHSLFSLVDKVPVKK